MSEDLMKSRIGKPSMHKAMKDTEEHNELTEADKKKELLNKLHGRLIGKNCLWAFNLNTQSQEIEQRASQ